ncbi:MAG: hypothetical protein U1E69_12105 [Tabrizicola sp.]|uniref:hypothetical protein n=1 Tax=Tabrizicola sp. TaxID=2005166 RepID=UPI002ABB5D61|nr:hypothetical protein [Tabrizicola sp.]MDZ4087528.1 hypothetical protein [Tabrizicola sp.]
MSERSMTEIEQSLERDRQALAQALVALRHRLDPATLISEGKAALMSQAQPLVSRVDGVVRGHPMAAAAAGVAIAALIFGRKAISDRDDAGSVAVPARFEALTRWEDEGGPPAPEPVDPEEDWLTEARGLRLNAKQLLRQIDDAARRGLAPAAQLAKHRAEVMSALAVETRTVLGKGLESLTEAARDQALQAREKVYLGRIALAEKGRAQVEEHPLLTGALVAAAGVALAFLFPQTETEDRLMGEARDRLLDDAITAAKSEAVKASELAQTLGSALKSDIASAASVFTPSGQHQTSARHH